MQFSLSEEQIALRKEYEMFAAEAVKPLAPTVDKEGRFPVETLVKIKDKGYLGLPFPEKFGGQGRSYVDYILCIEALSKACASTGVILSTHTSLCAAPIYEYGSTSQKEKYLTRLASGEVLGAFCLTEPSAGTDAAGQKTTAVLEGDSYVINGSKIFITNAGHAGVYIVMAMTQPDKGVKGISAFIVEPTYEGFKLGEKYEKMGIKGSTAYEILFENMRVPKENLLGEEGKGFKIALRTLDGGRIGIAAQALGIAQGALDETIAYVKSREQFGRPISAFQNTQFQIADMQTRISAARLLVYAAADAKQCGNAYSEKAAMAKLFASETAMDVTTKSVQLHGGCGYTTKHEVERMMRDAKITEIYEGTSEVQRMVISASVL